jgi:RNA polymerase sigma-70 factor (ECF subfamily)
MGETISDAMLLDRIRAGDKAACAICIEQHGPRIYRLALRLTKDEAEAEDVVQETFLQAFKGIDSFEGRAGLLTWLYRIAYNAALMHRRRDHPTVSIDEQLREEEGLRVPEQLFDWCCLPEQDLQTEEVRTELERAIGELPEALRVVFVLRELEGLSTEEVAHTLELSTDVVKQRLHRARLWLRERLSGYFVERVRG